MKTYTESQRFNQKWLWILILGIIGFLVYNLLSNSDLKTNWVALIVLVIISILLFLLRLDTKINKEGIHVTFFPFVKKTFRWDTMKTTSVVDYGFVGGWGFRYSIKHGIVYNVKGTKGILIHLKNGKKYVIGTQNPKAVEDVLAIYFKPV